MSGTNDQKDSIREFSALIRTAAYASSRAAELMSTWKPADSDDPEIAELHSVSCGLFRDLSSVVNLAYRGHYEEAALEGRILKFMCDGVADLRRWGRLKAQLVGQALREAQKAISAKSNSTTGSENADKEK